MHGARFVILLAALVLSTCTQEMKAPGQLIIAFDTDMAIPQEIDTIHVWILLRDKFLLDREYTVGNGKEATLPATLALAADEDPGAPVTVRVAGAKDKKWRTFRESKTTIPADRIALLRMPLQWLCDQQVKTVSGSGDSDVAASSCAEGQSCRAGDCVSSDVDTDPTPPLPTFTPAQVFGGGEDASSGRCFNTVACMAQGYIQEADANCTVARPTGGSPNVALRVAAGGICDASQTMCFVPLDAESSEGFLEAGNTRLQLPKAVCEKLGDGAVRAIYVSSACTTKTAATPPCGFWSSVPLENAIAPSADTMPVQAPARIASLPLDGGRVPCCSLNSDGGKLYTCTCDPLNKAEATLFEYDPSVSGGAPTMLTTLHPAAGRNLGNFFSTVAAGGALYVSADRQLLQVPLTAGAMEVPFSVGAGIYQTTTLLADPAGIYAFATVLDATGNMAASTQVLLIGFDGTVKRNLGLGGVFNPVIQFAQDGAAIYLALNEDVPRASDATKTDRVSRVFRLPKDGSASTAAMPDRNVVREGTDLTRGGYVSLQVEGSQLYTLFQDTPSADGRVKIDLARIDVNTGGTQQVLSTFTVDLVLSQVRLLGVIDGTAIVVRTDFIAAASGDKSTTIDSSSVFAVSDKGARIIMDLRGDAPSYAAGMTSDANNVYWLNQTGQIFGYSRSALR